LEPMERRARKEARGPCFLVFENRPFEDAFGGEMREEREPALAAVAEVFAGDGEASGVRGLPPDLPDLPEEGWREEEIRIRFVQIAFGRAHFYVGLPCQTLTFDEAMELLWHRRDFFYARERYRDIPRREVDDFDPFRKYYLYGDEDQATEDAAFCFFQVWELPVDTRLYVSSASFYTRHQWEQGVPVG
jgi:hypothetical protein